MEGLVVDRGFWQDKRVLLTGHTGFKGTWLSLWLVSLGADVAGFANGIPTTPSLFVDAALERELVSIVGDIRDSAAVRDAVATHRPEIVFHLAAQSLVRRSYEQPLETYATNVLGTAHVLDACRGVVPTVLVITSDKCYATSADSRPHPETDPLGGDDPYGSSKACAELVTAAYRSSYEADDTRIASARAGNVLGGGDWAEDRLVPDLVRGLLRGRAVPIRNPEAIRPWQHVLNPLEGYLRLAERLERERSYAEAWNFGPEAADERPVRWVVGRLSELWGGELETEPASRTGPPEAGTLRVDSTKARNRLGWRPRWSLDEALRRVVDWTRTYREGGDVRAAMVDQIQAHQSQAVRA